MFCLQTESKLTTFWSLVTDVDKQIFANDKFLSQASNDGIWMVCLSVWNNHLRIVIISAVFGFDVNMWSGLHCSVVFLVVRL